MLIPSKYENLEKSLLVVSAAIISLLKIKRMNLEDLFRKAEKGKSISLDLFYDALTFLWIADIIETDGFHVFLKRS
ncbi:MAG: hypothetical protein EHM20_06630 [Alphaproteobacteria bacterium]|nr:MAG: hypothetical protein EHM20_06630 [Alphaproteobacteria bacterium]